MNFPFGKIKFSCMFQAEQSLFIYCDFVFVIVNKHRISICDAG